MKIVKIKKYSGDAVEGFDVEFAERVYNACNIYHHMTFNQFYIKYYSMIGSYNRWEFIVFDDNDKIISSMAFYIDPEEINVQEPCMSVLAAFSTEPSHKEMTKGYQWMKQVGKEEEVNWMMLVKNVGHYEWRIRYKPIISKGE